jgi:predicted CXXCH cytochrome family protein
VRRALTLALLLLAFAFVTWRERRAIARDLARPRDLHGAAYATSDACRSCHPSHYESWHRTFHRRMTREAASDTVLAPFDGRTLDWRGVRATMTRDEEGAYWMTFSRVDTGGVLERDRVVRTVGSRRYQQYLTQRGSEYLRLPVAWHIEEQRFFQMNDAFFAPDPDESTRVWPDAFGRYVARWNDNCVFCHNVAPNPGRDASATSFRTTVAELGVACEACHGPGAEHARVNRDPARRYALHLGHDADPTIVNPARLSPSRSADLCGRCHGQRIADDVAPFLERGDPFVPGDDLARYTSPLWRSTPLAGRDDFFAARFWSDGTARLTAYEYQGLLQSPCAARGPMTCTSCHGMHDGDPRGQIRAEAVGDAACTQCHHAFERTDRLAQHTHHAASNASPRCIDCHMPRVVYGILDTHPSHRIENPDPARAARDDRPDACTLCHVDRSREWAIDARERFWPTRRARTAPADSRGTGGEAFVTLFAGDPVERAIAADAIGRAPPSRVPEDNALRTAALLEAIRGDRYATVRHLAWRALRRIHAARPIAALEHFDPSWPLARRDVAAREIADALGPLAVALEPERIAALRAQADERAIEVGE